MPKLFLLLDKILSSKLLLILLFIAVTTDIHAFSPWSVVPNTASKSTTIAPSILRLQHKRTPTFNYLIRSSKRTSVTDATATSTRLHASTVPTQLILNPIFDFTGESSSLETKQKSISSFERIDDAIMGGISLSALKDVPDQNYASWSGVCRTDGGGFCGMRTLPFQVPLNATNQDGIYIDCRLASDDEPERRMWKLTVRTDPSRGEMVFQSQFDLKEAMEEARERGEEWARVRVPWDGFQLVRGPRLVLDGPKLDVSRGIYQIGMTLSKFKIAVNTTELENFRPGFFDLHLQRIGFYQSRSQVEQDLQQQQQRPVEEVTKSMETVLVDGVRVPDTLSKVEAERKRPLLLKMLVPVAKLLFSEKANRRRSAMNLLREKRNMTRIQAILFGIKSRRKSIGWIPSVLKTMGILGVDSARTILRGMLKVTLLYPLRLLGMMVFTIKKLLGIKVNKPSSLKE